MTNEFDAYSDGQSTLYDNGSAKFSVRFQEHQYRGKVVRGSRVVIAIIKGADPKEQLERLASQHPLYEQYTIFRKVIDKVPAGREGNWSVFQATEGRFVPMSKPESEQPALEETVQKEPDKTA